MNGSPMSLYRNRQSFRSVLERVPPCPVSGLILQQTCMVAEVGEDMRNLSLCSDECSGLDVVLQCENLSKDRPNSLHS